MHLLLTSITLGLFLIGCENRIQRESPLENIDGFGALTCSEKQKLYLKKNEDKFNGNLGILIDFLLGSELSGETLKSCTK
jgi:hypothetical protein